MTNNYYTRPGDNLEPLKKTAIAVIVDVVIGSSCDPVRMLAWGVGPLLPQWSTGQAEY